MSPLDERQMSDAEGLMWRIEGDPHLSSTFGSISVLDRAPDFARLRATMERAITEVPRLQWRVQTSTANLSAPVWVDDDDFDLDYHLRRIALPKPATMRELSDLAALIVADPFDRLRPPWQFWVVEGLRGGKAALVQKMHHSITDGESGLRVSLSFVDLERDAPPRPARPAMESGEVPEPPSAARELFEAGFKVPLGLAREIRQLLADPASIPSAGASTVATVRNLLSQLTDAGPARSPLWTARSLRRRVETLSRPLGPVHAAAKRLGGTVNHALMTAAADAAGAYHRELGAPVDELRGSMAISTRTESSGSNAFTVAKIALPTGEMPIADRFRLVVERADAVRASAGGGFDAISSLAATLPTALVTKVARQQTQSIDFATSNVRAAPIPLYIAGSEVEATYPVGPLAGVAFNLTLMSYNGNLDLGLHLDAAAVTDGELLMKQLAAAFTALAAG